MIKNRNITSCFVLSIITCGIYAIIWYMNLTNDMGYLSKNRDFSGISIIFLTVITCGIYKIYWSYKIGKLLLDYEKENALPYTDNSVLYVVLSILGWDLINYCIIQSEVNKYANKDE